MAKKSVFTPESARRIAKGIRKVESMQSTPPASRARWGGGGDYYRILVAKAQETIRCGTSGSVKLMWHDDGRADYVEVGEAVQAFCPKGIVFTGAVIHLAEMVDCYEIVDPLMRFRGVTAEAIAENAVGDVSGYYRSGSTSYTDSGATIECLNDLDVDLESAATCEVVFDSIDGANDWWRIVEADYNCPTP